MKRSVVPNALTFANLLSGCSAMYWSFSDKPTLAAASLLLAVFFDGIDGKVARILRAQSPIGGELDSLADAISFGVAPAVFVLARFPLETLPTVIAGIFVCCGVFRLARYNTQPSSKTSFTGVPITTNGVLFPLLWFVHAPFEINVLALLVMSLLMVSSLKVPRLI